eukprot:189813-Rhodomonas_salina.1
MSGTDLAYAATRLLPASSEARGPQLLSAYALAISDARGLRACYAVAGTDIAYAGTVGQAICVRSS